MMRSDLLVSSSLKQARYQNIEQRNEEKVDEGGGKHPADDGGPNGILGPCSGPSGQCERQDPKEKSQRCHDYRPEPRSRRAKGRLDKARALRSTFSCKLDDQDGILCCQPESGETSNLKVDIVRETA